MGSRQYLCIDLKAFYASVECVERGLDPLTTNLVVADPARSEKTICLAISPTMKKFGIKSRCRVFEIPKTVDYVMAQPRMQLYIDYSAEIYGIYLDYIAKEDIHVYSIDEAFFDVTDYLELYHLSAKELALEMIHEIYRRTGLTATAGIGDNLYLAKIALDIAAKHASDYIGCLDESSYRRLLWEHEPLTDFWRVGYGTAKRLRQMGIRTMKDVAQADEELLYYEFGVDAELLIDHAWGRESTTMADIKAYKTENSSCSNGQVLPRDYDFEECRLIVKEMVDTLCLELGERGMVTDSLTLAIGFSNSLEMRSVHGTAALPTTMNTYGSIIPYVMKTYERIAAPELPIRRISVCCNRIAKDDYQQYSLFQDNDAEIKERKIQGAALVIKKKFGKNALVRGMDLEDVATTMERNRQIGGHKAE